MGDLEFDACGLIPQLEFLFFEINSLGRHLPRPKNCDEQKTALHGSEGRAGGSGRQGVATGREESLGVVLQDLRGDGTGHLVGASLGGAVHSLGGGADGHKVRQAHGLGVRRRALRGGWREGAEGDLCVSIGHELVGSAAGQLVFFSRDGHGNRPARVGNVAEAWAGTRSVDIS